MTPQKAQKSTYRTNIIKFNQNHKKRVSILFMRSRNLERGKILWDILAEKCMEWRDYILTLFKRREKNHSSLIEEYSIKRAFMEQSHVVEFLKEREKAINRNRYRMRIKEEENSYGDSNVIGRVTLLRNKERIDEAKLITKAGDSRKIIYWSFT